MYTHFAILTTADWTGIATLVGIIVAFVTAKMDKNKAERILREEAAAIKLASKLDAENVKATTVAVALASSAAVKVELQNADKKLDQIGGGVTNGRLLSFMLESAEQAMLIAEITKDTKWMEAAREKLKAYREQKAKQEAADGRGGVLAPSSSGKV